MEDKNKLFVFEKKEVVLIFLFIVLIAVISFTLGVRTGKQLSLKYDNYTQQDVDTIDLKSVAEENIDQVISNSQDNSFESSMDAAEVKDTKVVDNKEDSVEARLKEEMEKLAKEKVEVVPNADNETQNNDTTETDVTAPEVKTKEDATYISSDVDKDFVGKYTIQLFSHQSKEMAQDFADGFIIKGYDIIINEVVIPGKGKWYRVSVGIFNSVSEAKSYLLKEKDLFQDKNYVIQQI